MAVHKLVITEIRITRNSKVTDVILMEYLREIWHTVDNYFEFKGCNYY